MTNFDTPAVGRARQQLEAIRMLKAAASTKTNKYVIMTPFQAGAVTLGTLVAINDMTMKTLFTEDQHHAILDAWADRIRTELEAAE
ncbi:MAG: hypothetical protein Q4E11_07545 [Corynebacterium sp.]|uniref:hypothetical protein n=1 Tax=Corynebacterium sp. TaxID=1720 RepID=UPI0026DD8E7D|nr:hypothetical protein [Corynebacterium sp.]MDO5030421.1 hypothetical protein [Corynebacterium sp.]